MCDGSSSMHALRRLTGLGAGARRAGSEPMALYSPTPVVLNIAPVLQEKRFNWGPDPMCAAAGPKRRAHMATPHRRMRSWRVAGLVRPRSTSQMSE